MTSKFIKKISGLSKEITKNIVRSLAADFAILFLEVMGSTIFYYTMLSLTINVFGKYILPYIFFNLTGQEAEADSIRKEVVQNVRAAFEYLKNIDQRVFKKIAAGIVLGALDFAFNTQILARILREHHLMERGGYKPRFMGPVFRNAVIYAPITEEILFRGVIMNTMKIITHTVAELASTIKNFITGNRTQLEQTEELTAQKPSKLAQVTNNGINIVGTAMIFANAHSRTQKPYAFVGGLVLGTLYEFFTDEAKDGELTPDLTASVVTHMTNNYLAVRL